LDHVLRIDGNGAAQGADEASAQRMRSRAGEWRIAPSPRDVIVLRKLRDDPPCLRLAGEVRTPGALCDAISLIAQAAWGGELVVIAEDGNRSIYFEGGNVAGVATNVREERLGELLLRFGLITRPELEQTAASVKTTQRFGELAKALQLVGAQRLFPILAAQVEAVFFAALRVSAGMFYFYDRFDETALIQRHNLHTGSLLMESARQMDEMQYFRERIPSSAYVPVPSAGGRKAPEELAALYGLCDGRRSIADIGNRLGKLEFDVTRGVFQLASGGLVTVVPPRPEGAYAIIGVFNIALVEIHTSCQAAGKRNELCDGISRFATGIYETLFRGAGPRPDGSVDGDAVAKNLAALDVTSADEWLIELMHEYTVFATFQAESLLPREVHQALRATTNELLRNVRPIDASQPVPSRRSASIPPPPRVT
jgi:hypothetical protein